MTYQLLCEGQCTVKAGYPVHSDHQHSRNEAMMDLRNPKQQVGTRHWYRCQDCGAIRLYGWSGLRGENALTP